MNWKHATGMLALAMGMGVSAAEPTEATKSTVEVVLDFLGAAVPEPAFTGPTTHEFQAHVKVRSETGNAGLATLCTDAEGRVLVLLAPAQTKADVRSEVQVFSPVGQLLHRWHVDFAAQAINADADSVVYVAGDGRVACFDKSGKATGQTIELPYLADLFRDKEALRKRAEEQKKREAEQMGASLQEMRKQYEEMIKKIEEKPEAKRTTAENRQLPQLREMLGQFERMDSEQRGRTIETIMTEMASRARRVTSIAATSRDVFVVSGEVGGWGYGVWRLDGDLKNPKQVVNGLSGCCGQMDLQTQGDEILVAENTRHQFTRYDRDGKVLGQYGKRHEKDPSGFGGCCNPMNLRPCGKDIYTAESEGLIKRFTSDGKFVEVVGSVKLTGGCKHVAVATSPDASKVYFCDLPGSQFVILSRKSGQ